jgi:hypothetical protein
MNTFPYAHHSSTTFNSKAYPVKLDGKKLVFGYDCYWSVWSPVNNPHFVGHYKTEEAAQKKADNINERKSEWVYGY